MQNLKIFKPTLLKVSFYSLKKYLLGARNGQIRIFILYLGSYYEEGSNKKGRICRVNPSRETSDYRAGSVGSC